MAALVVCVSQYMDCNEFLKKVKYEYPDQSTFSEYKQIEHDRTILTIESVNFDVERKETTVTVYYKRCL